MIETIEKKLQELLLEQAKAVANINALEGAIQVCRELLKPKEEPTK